MTLHEKLQALATRLHDSGQAEDAAIVWAAAAHTAPMPGPTFSQVSQPAPGLYHFFQYYGR